MAGKGLTSLLQTFSGPFPHPTQGSWPETSAPINIWFASCPESTLPGKSPMT